MAGSVGSLACGECQTGTRLLDDAPAPLIAGFTRPMSSETAPLPLAKFTFAHAPICRAICMASNFVPTRPLLPRFCAVAGPGRASLRTGRRTDDPGRPPGSD